MRVAEKLQSESDEALLEEVNEEVNEEANEGA